MSFSDMELMAMCNDYTDETVLGGGAIKGKNCIIQSISQIENGNRVTFKWTLDDGTVQTQSMDVANGSDAGDEDFSLYPGAINVKTLGAKGDGTTDDSAAFLDAIDAAIEGGVAIIIPDGTYDLAGTDMTLGAALTFVGKNKKDVTLLNANITAPYGITCKGITFSGGTARSASVFDSGFPSYMKTKTIIIWARPDYDDASVSFESCAFKDAGIASCAYWSTSENRKPLESVTVKGCDFADLSSCGIWYSVDIGKAEFTGNTFKRIGDANTINNDKMWGISLGDASNNTAREAAGVIIENNYFDTLLTGDDTSNTTHYINANFISVVCDWALVRNNIIKNLVGYGKDREAVYTKGNNVEITQNLIIDGGFGEGYICAKYKADNMSAARCINIHDNVLIGEYGNGIQCYGNCYIHDNSISIRKGSRAIRGNAIPDYPYGALRVENNSIYCGAGPLVIDGSTISKYLPLNLISAGGEWLKGIYINGNSISTELTTAGYASMFGYLIYVEKAASDIEVKNNISSGSWVFHALGIVDETSDDPTYPTILDANKDITVRIEGNNFDTLERSGMTCGIINNPYLINKKYIVKDNRIRSIVRNWDISFALTVKSASVASNGDVLFYESDQPAADFKKAQVKTAASKIYTSCPDTFFSLESGATSTFISTNFEDYQPAT